MPTISDARREPVIDVRGVSVRYRIPHERVPTFKEFAIKWLRRRIVYTDLAALADVTLRIGRGEAVGVIGRNGAGKTTLLKVVARVLRPTEGRAVMRGRVAPLLELGAGFDMELSGRENIYLNGSLLGRTRRDMRERFDRIVEFAELAEFIDAPLRTYSTGMVARLGFAIATDIDADTLLIDEILSVGDVEFQQKCFARIDGFLRRDATMLVVSHSPDLIKQICHRAVWLDGGRVVADGPAADIVDAFVGGMTPTRREVAT